MMKKYGWGLILCLPLVFAWSQEPAPTNETQATCGPDKCELSLVMTQVKDALDKYQRSIGSGPDALPPLMTAEFDFKATTSKTVGGTINFFIFTIGASHENDQVQDVTYTYSVPPPEKKAGLSGVKKPPVTLTEALVSTIQNAAFAVKTSGTVGKLKFKQLTVNVQYGVIWSGKAGANIPISFVTTGLSGEIKKNTVQSVKLVFAAPTGPTNP